MPHKKERNLAFGPSALNDLAQALVFPLLRSSLWTLKRPRNVIPYGVREFQTLGQVSRPLKRVGLRTGCGIWQLDQTQGQAGMNFIQEYGYLGIAVVVGLKSMGLPLPGESPLLRQRSTPARPRR